MFQIVNANGERKTVSLADLSNPSGVLSPLHGGTGLDALGSAGQLLQVNAGGDALEYTSALAVNSISALSGAGLGLYDDAGNGLFIKDGGFVGLGTTDPQVNFHVQNSGNVNQWFESLGGRANIFIISADTSSFARFGMIQGPVLSPAARYDIGLAEDGSGRFYIGGLNLTFKFLTIDGTNGNVGVGPGAIAPSSRLHVIGSTAAVPVITGQGAASQSANLLQLLTNASAIQFAIGPAGSIRTNQTAAATSLGSVTNRLPIYNAAGTLVGYIPIYDSIT